MLDVHILIHPETRKDWVSQCLDSVYAAADRAGYPAAVHPIRIVDECPQALGHIGRGRAYGYGLGEHPYVTCVDDDDYVLPGAFAQMHDALAAGASAVCTPEQRLQNGCITPGPARHHLIAYRRSDIIDHAQWSCCGDVAQMQAIPDDAIDLPESMYVHRIYMDSRARVMRRYRQDELRVARG